MDELKEMWLPIAEAPDYYISNHGRVLSSKFGRPRFLKLYKKETGYFIFRASINGKQKSMYVHKLVAAYFIPNPDNLPQVDHIDRNSTNNVVTNLRWVTTKEQNHNRNIPRGISNGRAILTEDDVRTIRARRKKGESYVAIALDYPVSSTNIRYICNRKYWKHLD